jgi:hypothetical protein
MRDDLHRTLALSRPWQRVLRHAQREADRDKVPGDIQRAVDEHMRAEISPDWRKTFIADLTTTTSDLFGLDKQVQVIDQAERQCRTPLERRLCETVRGLHDRDGARAGLYEDAEKDVRLQFTRSNIEQLCAKLQPHARPGEVLAMQAQLISASAQTQIETQPPKKSKRRSKEAMESLLARKIAFEVK